MHKEKNKVIPIPNGLEIQQQIAALDRNPFRVELAKLLDCSPDIESLKTFANKSPDRWSQAVSILSKLSGFSEKTVHEHNINVLVATMSDAQIQDRIKHLEHKSQVETLTATIPASETPVEHRLNPIQDTLIEDAVVIEPKPKKL